MVVQFPALVSVVTLATTNTAIFKSNSEHIVVVVSWLQVPILVK
jgi:hypothetical protein